MSRISSSMVLVVLLVPLCLGYQDARARESTEQARSEKQDSQAEQSPEILSPLHALVGIDPVTGEFTKPKAKPKPSTDKSDRLSDGGNQAVAGGDDPQEPVGAAAPEAGTSEEPTPRASVLADRLDAIREADRPEAALQALSELLQDADQETLSQLAAMLPEALRDEPIFRRYLAIYWWMAVATAAILAIWAMGVLLAELAGWWIRRGEASVSEFDRRYYRTRFRRRLLQAGLVLALAGLVLAAGSSTDWWTSPVWLTVHLGGTLVLALWAWAVGALIKRSARWYSQAVVRDLRRHHLELQQEVQELRQRVANMRLSVGV